MKHIIKPAFALFIIAAAVTALLGFVYEITKAPRENQRKKTREITMNNVLPQASEFREIAVTPSGTIVGVVEGLNGSEITGYIIELEPKGYGGTISMMVGISDNDSRITGMRIMQHSETPGLGALASHENFYRRFDGKDMVPLGVVKTSAGENEIEAISGSTITTKAITDAVNEAIEWYSKRTGQ
ncbi:MAG: RnfABCDGE type electron transport complex subunit G [Treponema sp.]|nr:RnfABCDGE type electron transport complex subunit G [Treponema sp.]